MAQILSERMIVNRRQLLHTLSVLTAGSAWGTFSSATLTADFSLPASYGHRPLLLALTRSKVVCESILGHDSSVSAWRSSIRPECLKELSALIAQANFRVVERCHYGPAFWQACSDAFQRVADQMAALRSVDHPAFAMFQEAESTFRRTAQLLEIETTRTASLSFGGTDALGEGRGGR